MLPHLLPEEPSRGISPDSPPSAPAFSPVCLLSCTFQGCLKQCYGQHRPGEGLALALPPSLATSFPFHPREGGRDRDFFYTREKKKNGCFFFSGGGLVEFFCLSLEAVGLKFSFLYTHTHARAHMHMCTHLGPLADLGPPPAGVVFLSRAWASTPTPATWPEPGFTDPVCGFHSPALLSCWAGMTSQGLPFR